MKKSFWNVWIDLLSWVVFTTMISTGLLLRFILPPGSGRREIFLVAKGRSHQTIDLFMGLTRHEWGAIHFYISWIFLILLLVHLFLHWEWIVCIIFGTKAHPKSKQRVICAWILLLVSLVVLSFPWVGKWAGLKKTYQRGEISAS